LIAGNKVFPPESIPIFTLPIEIDSEMIFRVNSPESRSSEGINVIINSSLADRIEFMILSNVQECY
jgi:hypothetical protein